MKRATYFRLGLILFAAPLAIAAILAGAEHAVDRASAAPPPATAPIPPLQALASGPRPPPRAPVPSPGARWRSRDLLCEGGGRFRVDGPPLVLGREGLSAIVSISGQQIAIGTACPLVPVTFGPGPGGTLVTARWPACAGLPHGAHLQGVINGPTCGVFHGTLHVPGQGRGTMFRAYLIPCLEFSDECAPEDFGALAFQRWLSQFSPRAFPRGYIPKAALSNAYRQLAAAPIARDHWVSLGPAPMRAHPENPSERVSTINSGLVSAIAVDPNDPSHVLIGTAGGGIWETRTAGGVWDPRTDDQPSLEIGAIAFAPGSPGTVYAGTGLLNWYAGAGLLKSTDGGATWSLLAAGTFAGLGFSGIQVSSETPNSLVAATLTPGDADRIFTHSPPDSPPAGVYRSTTGGASWALRLAGEATALVVHPTDFSHQYAALGKQAWAPGGSNGLRSGVRPNGLYRSLNGGQNWTWIGGPWIGVSGGVGEVRLALSPSQPDVLYASIRDRNNGVGHDGALLGIWKTQDAWAPTPTWVEAPKTGLPSGPVDSYHHVITVHAGDPDVLYWGSVKLWKLQDGTWVKISEDADGDLIHVDMVALAWGFPFQLLVGTDGGIYRKDELLGGPWQHLNTNLAITHFNGGAVFPAAPDRPVGAANDHGFVQRDPESAPLTWRLLFNRIGDGLAIFPGADPPRMGVAFNTFIPMRSTNGGVTSEGTEIPYDAYISTWETQAMFRRCPANENVAIAGSQYVGSPMLWRTDNFFSAPTAADVSWLENAGFGQQGASVTAVAFAPSDPTCQTYAYATNRMFASVGTKGDLFIRTGGVWLSLDPAHQLPGRYVSSLAFAPNDAHTLYVTLSGFDEGTPGEPGHVFKTTNATSGAPVWTDVSPPVDLPANVVALDPAHPGTVYIGTDIGSWESDDAGATWAHSGPASGMPNVAVNEIALDPCGVTAFTWGRGAFRRAVPFVCP